jgi:AcrR family transcriptional regulator
MGKLESIPEKRIIEAARVVFQRRGYAGARLHEIAEEAGINQALLHYYYRSKDRLFEAVFREAAGQIFPIVLSVLDSETPLEEKIEQFVHRYVDLLLEHPYMPGFVIHELTQNESRLKNILSNHGFRQPRRVLEQYAEGVKAGRYLDIDPEQFLVTLLSACVFPFVARPLIQMAMGFNDEEFRSFLQKRKKQVAQLILNGIRR